MNYPWGSVRFAWGIHCPVLLCPYVAPWVSQSVRIRPRYRVFIATKIWYFKQNCNFKFELLYGVILWRIKCLTRNTIHTALKNNNMPCHTIQYNTLYFGGTVHMNFHAKSGVCSFKNGWVISTFVICSNRNSTTNQESLVIAPAHLLYLPSYIYPFIYPQLILKF